MPERPENTQKNMETFGPCPVCGAARGAFKTTLDGGKTPYVKLICTYDETHDPA